MRLCGFRPACADAPALASEPPLERSWAAMPEANFVATESASRLPPSARSRPATSGSSAPGASLLRLLLCSCFWPFSCKLISSWSTADPMASRRLDFWCAWAGVMASTCGEAERRGGANSSPRVTLSTAEPIISTRLGFGADPCDIRPLWDIRPPPCDAARVPASCEGEQPASASGEDERSDSGEGARPRPKGPEDPGDAEGPGPATRLAAAVTNARSRTALASLFVGPCSSELSSLASLSISTTSSSEPAGETQRCLEEDTAAPVALNPPMPKLAAGPAGAAAVAETGAAGTGEARRLSTSSSVSSSSSSISTSNSSSSRASSEEDATVSPIEAWSGPPRANASAQSSSNSSPPEVGPSARQEPRLDSSAHSAASLILVRPPGAFLDERRRCCERASPLRSLSVLGPSATGFASFRCAPGRP
mmetsp:Transcript_73651/g.158019  ORF Transcript_73651/g.158019 Transcript_73651/m.158019 type:complete len:423 (-) Transcript_73651:4-1272(-)